MSRSTRLIRSAAFRLYVLGHVCVLVGAGLMSETGSMLPMAAGASAGLLLAWPLIRHFRPHRVL